MAEEDLLQATKDIDSLKETHAGLVNSRVDVYKYECYRIECARLLPGCARRRNVAIAIPQRVYASARGKEKVTTTTTMMTTIARLYRLARLAGSIGGLIAVSRCELEPCRCPGNPSRETAF